MNKNFNQNVVISKKEKKEREILLEYFQLHGLQKPTILYSFR